MTNYYIDKLRNEYEQSVGDIARLVCQYRQAYKAVVSIADRPNMPHHFYKFALKKLEKNKVGRFEERFRRNTQQEETMMDYIQQIIGGKDGSNKNTNEYDK